MKKVTFVLLLVMLCILRSFAQYPVDFRINSGTGFSDPNGNQNIVVLFPGKNAHEIYNMIAVNVGLYYYSADDVMYGVPDKFISVTTSTSDFCRAGDEKWSGFYVVKFLITDGKVLVLNPTVREVKSGYDLRRKKLNFIDFINEYWYGTNGFISSERQNMNDCEEEVNRTINILLGIRSLNIIPKDW